MLRVGAHVSISGGFEKAVSRQRDLGGTCGQIFVGSPRGWEVSAVEHEEAERFKTQTQEDDIGPWIIHGTYLINFATPKDDLGSKSMETVQAELDAAAALDIPYYVFHPGSHTGAGIDQGLENIGTRLSELQIPDNVTLLLENTAGRGTSLGKSFDELDQMITGSTTGYDAIGVCLDTCHLWAAGYEFDTQGAMDELVEQFDATIGLENLHYIHLNDSKHPAGSEKDEHEHIGEGEIGEDGFEIFINHDAVRDLPMALETPDDDKGYAWNIEKINSLYQ